MSAPTHKASEKRVRHDPNGSESASKTSISTQEEFARAWEAYMATMFTSGDWFERPAASGSRAARIVKEWGDQSVHLLEKSSRANIHLLTQATRTFNTICLNTEIEQWQMLAGTWLERWRAAAEGMVRLQSEIVNWWMLHGGEATRQKGGAS